MRKVLCLILIASMIVPFFPARAWAQLLLNPANVTEMPVSGARIVAGTAAAAASAPSFDLTQYVQDRKIAENYKLGPGDQLEVHLIVGDNALALDYNFVINPEGKIFFPNIGEIYLSGLNLSSAKARITGKIKSKYHENFELSLMVTKPKMVKLYVVGQVSRPGLYTVYDGSRVSEIVKIIGVEAGGSERRVLLKRGDQQIKVDLYNILYRGNVGSDVGIEMGDVIEVPPSGSARVTVMGEVLRPGQYELEDGEKLKDALAMAGYVGVNSALSEVAYLKRQKGKEEFSNYKLNLYDMFLKGDDSQNVALSDGDIISIPSIKAFVYMYGEIGRGGRFEYIPGYKLSDYVNMAGGPTPKAHLKGVTVTRQENGKPKVYGIDVSEILRRGIKTQDIEIMAGDVVFVPGNFFYFSDFASFANTVLLALTLYSSIVK